MAKDRRKLQHIHSSIPDKQPTPQSLEVGEIAVNNAANQEFLSIKNSDDVVKRFSSDEQIITWMERKEVMPYEGYTRGADGPAGSTGPDSITNDDLLQNKSNLIIKLNQVAASNTVKHDKVNGAKDIYGKCVNPTSDSGVTDGAGFAIDMSRYAMMDANPSFSAATVSAQTNLSGNTYITNGASANTYGTDTGHTLTITTTDVVDTNTNWTETITNKQSTVTNETDKITTLNESATTRNTTVGTETLHVSGTTTETHDKDVTITNNSGVTETTKGNVVENVSGTTTINHSGTTTINESGDTIVNTTGSTTIQSTGAGSDVTIYAKDDLCATSDDVAAFRGVNKTNVGIDCSDASRTKVTNVYGDTINVRGNTADTRVTSAYTSATTATTVIGTANTSATTADYSGNTLNSHIKSWTHSGDTLNITESTSTTLKSPTTTISGCTKIDLISDDLNFQSCTSAGTIDFDFCNGFNVNSNAVKFEQCSTAGTFTIKEKATNISGTTLDINEKDKVVIVGDNKVHIGGETVETSCELFDVDADTDVCIDAGEEASFYGADKTKVGVNCTNQLSKNTVINSLSGTVVSSDSDTCIYGRNVNVGGDIRTRIGANCQGTVDSNYVEISAITSITETAPIIELSSSTTNLISNATNIDAISHVCVSAGTVANFYGRDTRIGIECDGTTIATSTTIEGTTVEISGNTTNITGNTELNIKGKDICISGNTEASFGAKTVKIGTDCGNNTIASGVTVIATSAITLNAPTINITGNSYTVDVTGDTCTNGNNAYFGGSATTKIGYSCSNALISDYTTVGSESGTTIETKKGNLNVHTSGNTILTSTGTTTLTSTGTTTIEATGANSDVCLSATDSARVYGKGSTYLGVKCDGTIGSATTIEGTTTTISANTLNETSAGNTNINVGGNLTENVSGNTKINTTGNTNITTTGITDIKSTDAVGISSMSSGVDIYGKTSTEIGVYAGAPNTYSSATTIVGTSKLNISGGTTTINSTNGFSSYTTGNTCVQSTGDMNIGADGNTNIGTNCTGGVYSNNVGISAQTAVTINGGNNIDLKSPTINISGGTGGVNISGATRISGTTTIGDTLTLVKGLSKNITFQSGSYGVSGDNPWNGSGNTTVTIPNTISDVTSKKDLTIQYGTNVSNRSSSTTYNVTAARTVDVPTALGQISNGYFYDSSPTTTGGCISSTKPLCITGTVTASGAIYSSDRNLKENISSVCGNKELFEKAANVDVVSFNFKGEADTKYGVIAQDVQKAGLDELVYENNGNLGVDYTSLLMLKIAYLEDTIKNLTEKIEKLENK